MTNKTTSLVHKLMMTKMMMNTKMMSFMKLI